MGHPVFRVTQAYDPSTKALKLTVEQQQKVDPDSQFPQVTLFQTPVDIEIATASETRIERVRIEPKQEQTFTLKADSKPLLVNFDYNGTLIKEIDFKKSKEELVYQVANDQDPLGRLWALNQLPPQIMSETSAEGDKQQVIGALADALTHDKFWGIRFEAAAILSNVKGDTARKALLDATKDQNAKVRARAITSLSASKDASLSTVYQQFLNDPSYGVIRAAALALGQTKSPTAYDALVKLLESPSWRNNIRASGLSGLAALGDKRALEMAFRYAGTGNYPQVRGAALRLLATVGKDDPRAFPLISEMLKQSVNRLDFALLTGSAEALVSLGDSRGLTVFEEISKQEGNPPQLQTMLTQYQERLRKSSASADKPATPQP
jgi:aminopeptidase N